MTTSDVPLADRSDEQVTDDLIACLRHVNPKWLALFPDDSALMLHVRDTLDDLEGEAREHGRAETGCMVVEYDREDGQMRWSVLVAYRYDDNDEGEAPESGTTSQEGTDG